MIKVERTFEVQCPAQAALRYLADFGNAPAWDPGTVTCERIGDPAAPVAVGSRWHNVSKLIAVKTELEYELVEWTADHVRLVGTNKTAKAADTITVTPIDDARSTVHYEATVVFAKASAIADPFMWLIFQYLARGTVSGITEALEGAQTAV